VLAATCAAKRLAVGKGVSTWRMGRAIGGSDCR
jgi:hypothetical protein